jgi:hypothetical protein
MTSIGRSRNANEQKQIVFPRWVQSFTCIEALGQVGVANM